MAAAGLAALSLLSGCSASAPASRAVSTVSTDSTDSTDSTAGASTASASTLTPTPTPTAARQPSPTISPTCSTGAVLSTWTLARLAEQIVIVPVQEDSVTSVTAQVAAGVGGVILFGSSAPPNIALSLARLARSAPDGLAPLVMVDEEGGSVQRMANLVGSIPSARQMGATMTASQIARLATDLGRRLRALGVTVDLAPVLDADGRPGPNDENPIGSRSFSADPLVARADGLAFAEGLQSSGVLAVVKHFPGLGGASGNSDLGPSVTLPWATVRESGLLPFAAAAAFPVAAVMVANASVPGLTKLPASISAAAITGVLRDQLGFRGLVVTDSMSAVALSGLGYSVPMASVAAVRAGADMVLFNASAATMAGLARGTVVALVSSVERGTLARVRLVDAVNHILAAKHVDLCAVR